MTALNNEASAGLPLVGLGYFAKRWRGQVKASQLLLWDILAIGTALNVATGLVSLLLLVKGETYSAVLIHFALMPYNLFLVISLSRLSARSNTALAIAVVWFVLMLLV